MGKKQDLAWFDRFNPACNITGLLMFIGCSATIYFTETKNWDVYGFTVCFTAILTGGKGMKILDAKLNKGSDK